jgi:hypothetical protein
MQNLKRREIEVDAPFSVKKFFEMLEKGEADGIETVFLLPADTTDSEIRDLKCRCSTRRTI